MTRIVHFEIHAADPARAMAFYSGLLGWTFEKWSGPMDYWMTTTGAEGQMGINGGLMLRQGPAPSEGQPVNAFVCTAGVDRLDDCLGRLDGLGGKVAMPRMAVPGIGWLAYVRDTEGNLLGLLQPDMAAA